MNSANKKVIIVAIISLVIYQKFFNIMTNKLHNNLYLAKKELGLQINNKAGVYQLVNLVNEKSYVGSSANLYRRLNEYLNPLYISRNLKKGQSRILNALLKYGHINFGIRILEVIDNESDLRNTILSKEQYFIELINPEYNINQIAGSNLGRIFSEEVRAKMSKSKIGKPGNKKGAILFLETRALFREKSGMTKSINMLNENKEILATFKSIQIASEVTGIPRSKISRCVRGIQNNVNDKGNVYIFEYTNLN